MEVAANCGASGPRRRSPPSSGLAFPWPSARSPARLPAGCDTRPRGLTSGSQRPLPCLPRFAAHRHPGARCPGRSSSGHSPHAPTYGSPRPASSVGLCCVSSSLSLVGCVADVDKGAHGHQGEKVAATVLQRRRRGPRLGGPRSAAPAPAAATLGRVWGRKQAAADALAARDPQGLQPLTETRSPPSSPLWRTRPARVSLSLSNGVVNPFASPWPFQGKFGV